MEAVKADDLVVSGDADAAKRARHERAKSLFTFNRRLGHICKTTMVSRDNIRNHQTALSPASDTGCPKPN